ncbi:MAG TPA: hypothetical protein VK447_18690 [Myxococcaceae bacterium]|nr:hypothetical protein [Myxococcaceae bacterium]
MTATSLLMLQLLLGATDEAPWAEPVSESDRPTLYRSMCPGCPAPSELVPGHHLADLPLLMKDPAFRMGAERIAWKEQLAGMYIWGGLIGGAAHLVLGLAGFYSGCGVLKMPCKTDTAVMLVVSSPAFPLLGMILSFMTKPTQGEVVYLVNEWNMRHPELPRRLSPAVGW